MKIEVPTWTDVNAQTAAIDILVVRIFALDRRLRALCGRKDPEGIAEYNTVLAEQRDLHAQKRELTRRRDALKREVQAAELNRAFGGGEQRITLR